MVQCGLLGGVCPTACVDLFTPAALLRFVQGLTGIESLRCKLPEDAVVGAGTVLKASHVQDAEWAGASFIVSPNTDASVVDAAKERDLVSVPGAFTASEVIQAEYAGADIVKLFPVRPVGADYIRQLRGPLGDTPLLASGGVDAELASHCFAAGCQAVGVGIHLLGVDILGRTTDWSELVHQAQNFRLAAGL